MHTKFFGSRIINNKESDAFLHYCVEYELGTGVMISPTLLNSLSSICVRSCVFLELFVFVFKGTDESGKEVEEEDEEDDASGLVDEDGTGSVTGKEVSSFSSKILFSTVLISSDIFSSRMSWVFKSLANFRASFKLSNLLLVRN